MSEPISNYNCGRFEDSKNPTADEGIKKIMVGGFPWGKESVEYMELKSSKMHADIENAVDEIMADMPLKNRVEIAKLEKNELLPLKLALIADIENKFDAYEMDDYLKIYFIKGACEKIDLVWRKLKETHRLRVVKPHRAP